MDEEKLPEELNMYICIHVYYCDLRYITGSLTSFLVTLLTPVIKPIVQNIVLYVSIVNLNSRIYSDHQRPLQY